MSKFNCILSEYSVHYKRSRGAIFFSQISIISSFLEKPMLRLIFFLFFISNLFSQIMLDPLYQNYYRPGFWWPARFSKFQKSHPNMKVSLENFTWEFKENNESIGYFLIKKKLSHLIIHSKQKKIYEKHISLKKIKQTDKLIGIYASKNTIIPSSTSTIFFIHLQWLPDAWEGLSSLNALFLNTNIKTQYELAIKKWVCAGGSLFTSAKCIPNFVKENHFGEIFFSYGRGKIHIIPEFSISKIIHLSKIKSGKVIEIKQISHSPPPQKTTWSFIFQVALFIVCIFHCIIIIICYFFIKSKQFRIATMSILTIITTATLILWLSQYEKVAYNKWIIQKCIPGNNVTFNQKIHTFTSLQKQKWEHKFNSLPLPTKENKDFHFARYNNSWYIKIPNFKRNEIYTFQTFYTEEYIGSASIYNEKDILTFSNNMEIEWTNLHWKQKNKNFYIGNCSPGKEILISKNHLQVTNFENIYIHWLQKQLPEKSLYSFSNKETGVFMSIFLKYKFE